MLFRFVVSIVMCSGGTDTSQPTADSINRFGVTVANGMIGLVSSQEPMLLQSIFYGFGGLKISGLLC